MRCDNPALNASTATTPADAAITAENAERTGTVRVPRPRENACRSPIETVGAFNGQSAHLEPMLARSHLPTGLLPRIPCGEDEHPIEICLMESALGGVQMGYVDRVEGSAEDSGSHGYEHRAAGASPIAALG